MASTIAGIDLEQYLSDPRCRASINSNIRAGWLFIAVPQGSHIIDFKKIGDKVLVNLATQQGIRSETIKNEPGIQRIA
jgi:hypothetical protein